KATTAGTDAAAALAASVDAVKYDSAAHNKVTLGAEGTPVTLANVATGVANTDAVNVAQLNAGINSVTVKTAALNDALKYVGFGPSIAGFANASGTDSMALGGNAFATADRSLAIGLNARAGYADSVAIGTNSSVTAANTVSVGSAGKERKIMFVAQGTKTTDAVNLGQVQSMIAGLAPVQQQQVLQSPVAMQVLGATKLGASAQNWTDVLATGDTDKLNKTQAVGTDAMAIGLNTHATDAQATAIGQNTLATAKGSVAIGNSSTSNGIEATAIGVNASSTAEHALSIGYSSLADATDSIAIGTHATVGLGFDSGIAIGNEAVVTGAGSFALGNNSTVSGTNTVVLGSNNIDVTGNNSVILGAGSDGSQSNVVSVGAKGSERKIVNVAAGTTTTDAVNLGQMTKAISDAGTGTGGGGSTLITQDSTSKDLLVGGAVDGTHVNFASTSGAARELINVAAGTTNTSAVNLSQLKPVVTALGGNATVDAAGNVTGPTYNVQGGTQTTVGAALSSLDTGLTTVNTKIAGMGPSLVTQAAAGSDLLVGASTDGSHVNFAGTSGNRELINVAAGTKPTSAVNLSQLTPVVAGLGGGATINTTTGAVTGPTYSIGGVDKHSAGEAFSAIDGSLTDLKGTVADITGSTGSGMVIQDATTRDIKVGSVNDGTVVDMTGTEGARKITGVAAGSLDVSSLDAINGSQLNSVGSQFATAIGGGAMMNSDGSFTQPSFNVGGNTVHNVGDAITGLDGRINTTNETVTNLQTQVTNIAAGSGGVATPNAVAYDSNAHDTLTLDGAGGTKLTGLADGDVAAGSTDAITGNQFASLQAAVTDAVKNISTTGDATIGINGTDGKNGINGVDGAPAVASATGNDAIAMGDGASASGEQSTVIGGGSSATGDQTVVIGGGSTASGTGTVVIGGGASGTADGTVAIGQGSNASGENSIAIGNGATAPNTNSVALGANSTTDRDNSVSVGSADQQRQITNVAPGTQGTDAVNLNQMNQAVGGIARKAYSGIAAATALTMIPDVDANKTLSLGIGGGTFQGYAATAIGGTARITQNIKVRVGAGWSAAGTTVGAGASYQW
ncbi:hypothetical protein ASG35_30500, partial [Burkholderia sp. Leaf177]|uniref:YadA-like family protein n=1 Tax=Burkholderia sp. Leaf177 TaxID=1736287 RepID=UPI0006F4B643